MISDKYRHRAALILSVILLATGAVLWANVSFMGTLSMLFVAQLTLGLGTGFLGVARSFVVEQVAPAKRTYMLARLSALQYAGFAATPLLGSALVMAGDTISTVWEYALPGYLVLALALLCLWLLVYQFQDIKKMYEHTPETLTVHELTANPLVTAEEGAYEIVTLRSYGAVEEDTTEIKPLENEDNKRLRNRVFVLMMFLNFTTRGGIAVYETQGSQILLDEYNLPQWQLGLLVSTAGKRLQYVVLFHCTNDIDTAALFVD